MPKSAIGSEGLLNPGRGNRLRRAERWSFPIGLSEWKRLTARRTGFHSYRTHWVQHPLSHPETGKLQPAKVTAYTNTCSASPTRVVAHGARRIVSGAPDRSR